MTKDWLFGFLSGVLATIVGFVLTMAWDLWKDKRQKAERTRMIETAVGADLVANAARIRRNVGALKQELPMLAQRMDVVAPLTLLRTSFWDVAKLYPPGQLITSEEMTKLHELFDLAEQVNEQIRSRETFRQHNGAMTHFGSRMKIYDEDLVEAMTRLEATIMALDPGSTSTSPKPAA
jgi:hypothetical protein